MTRSNKAVEIGALSGARALPPLLIVLFHFGEGHHYYGVPFLDLLAARGYLWVEFFFALSGFILSHVYGARLAQLLTLKGFGAFLKARLARLYPLHLFMLLALALLLAAAIAHAQAYHYVSYYQGRYRPNMTLKALIYNLLLIHGWNTLPGLSWNTPSWFVSVEFALCLIFPLLLWLANGGLSRGCLLIAAGLAGLAALDVTTGYGLDITFHNGVLRGLADFSIGVGMAVLFRFLKPRDALPDWAHGVIQLLLFGMLLYALTHSGWSHSAKDIWSVLPMLALILALAFDRGWLAALLQTSVMQKMGGWSYAVYMGQAFWLQFIRLLEARAYPPADAIVLGVHFSSLIWWLEPLCLVLVCLLWGGLLARYVEHPAAKALKPVQSPVARGTMGA